MDLFCHQSMTSPLKGTAHGHFPNCNWKVWASSVKAHFPQGGAADLRSNPGPYTCYVRCGLSPWASSLPLTPLLSTLAHPKNCVFRCFRFSVTEGILLRDKIDLGFVTFVNVPVSSSTPVSSLSSESAH